MIMASIFKKGRVGISAALAILFLTTISTTASAYFSLDLTGMRSDDYVDLEEHVDTTMTASLLMGLGDYVIVSLGHQREMDNKHGYHKTQTSDGNIMYYKFEDDSEVITTFSDLTVILYNGMFSPFVFGGIARKDYYSTISYPGTVYKSHMPLPLIHRYGFGFSITLSREFRLKITQTFSPGVRIELVDQTEEVPQKYVSTTTEIGISMRLN